MEKNSAQEINDLASKFSDKSLPKSDWTHQAHIIVAVWHNMNYDFDVALELIKSKIKTYNISVGTINTENSGYHETLTIFWMLLIKTFLLRHPSLQIEEACHQFLLSDSSSNDFPLEFYSSGILFSNKARKKWINGDIKNISLLSNNFNLNNHFDLSDDQFVWEFKDCTLSPDLFNHEAHLRLAWIHVKKAGLKKATINICDQITAYVNYLGVQSKYNQTLTVAAVKIVNHYVQLSESDNFFDFILEFPSLKTNFKELVETHYSFDIFNSKKAKREFLEPDLIPFE